VRDNVVDGFGRRGVALGLAMDAQRMLGEKPPSGVAPAAVVAALAGTLAGQLLRRLRVAASAEPCRSVRHGRKYRGPWAAVRCPDYFPKNTKSRVPVDIATPQRYVDLKEKAARSTCLETGC